MAIFKADIQSLPRRLLSDTTSTDDAEAYIVECFHLVQQNEPENQKLLIETLVDVADEALRSVGLNHESSQENSCVGDIAWTVMQLASPLLLLNVEKSKELVRKWTQLAISPKEIFMFACDHLHSTIIPEEDLLRTDIYMIAVIESLNRIPRTRFHKFVVTVIEISVSALRKFHHTDATRMLLEHVQTMLVMCRQAMEEDHTFGLADPRILQYIHFYLAALAIYTSHSPLDEATKSFYQHQPLQWSQMWDWITSPPNEIELPALSSSQVMPLCVWLYGVYGDHFFPSPLSPEYLFETMVPGLTEIITKIMNTSTSSTEHDDGSKTLGDPFSTLTLHFSHFVLANQQQLSLDITSHSTLEPLALTLMNATTFTPDAKERRLALKVFQTLIEKCTPESVAKLTLDMFKAGLTPIRILSLMTLKSSIVNAFDNQNQSSLFASRFLGEFFLRPLRDLQDSLYTSHVQSSSLDSVEQKRHPFFDMVPLVMHSGNLLYFLLIRDTQNRTGIWDSHHIEGIRRWCSKLDETLNEVDKNFAESKVRDPTAADHSKAMDVLLVRDVLSQVRDAVSSRDVD